MGLILRVDIDKPYGNTTLVRKIASKLVEDFYAKPLFNSFGYLTHFANFLKTCNDYNVSGIMYHRICTIPNEAVMELIKKGNHKIGLHAENTRNLETFSNELNTFKSLLPDKNIAVESFSKHGSGKVKIGKYHYAPYEAEKYLEWAKQLNLKFPFGNEIGENENDFLQKNNFHKSVFWIERDYRSSTFNTLEQLVEVASIHDVGVLIHPCNYDSTKNVADDFHELIKMAKEKKIEWRLI